MSEGLLLEWVGLLFRWLHVVAALMWIGASFYLISWENKFNRQHGLRDGVEGDFWTIQGGDFYFVEKLKSAPRQLPAELHWFKYESYFTWLSGFLLMCVFYYASPSVMLLDRSSPLTGSFSATLSSIGSLVLVWLLYSWYAGTSHARNLRLSALIGLVFVALLSLFYSYLFNGRAAVIHVGAALGTIMSANVFFSIIPWHKRLIRAIEVSKPLDDIYRTHPGFRSRHNHYLTLPVLILMLSAHAPVNFDGRFSWLVVTLLVLAMGLLKHFHTCIQRRQPSFRFLAAGVLVFLAVVMVSAADSAGDTDCSSEVSRSDVQQILVSRCSSCHNSRPAVTVAGSDTAIPALVTPEELGAFSSQIHTQVVTEKTMPPANITGMTDAERIVFRCWLEKNGRSG